MRFFDQLGYAGNSIKTRKARAGLTTLGITIGIAAIVALLALSNGFQASIEEQFELGFSTNVLFVTKNTGGYGETADPNFQLYINDSDTISGLSPHINLVVPRLAQPVGGCNITVGGKNYTIGSVMGVNFTKFNDLYPTTFATTNGSIPIEDSNTSVVIGYKYGQDPYNYKVGDNITLTWYDHNLKGNPILNASHTYNATVAAILPAIGGFGLGGPSDSGVYIQLTPAIDAFQSNVSMSIGIRIDSDEQSVIDEVIAIR